LIRPRLAGFEVTGDSQAARMTFNAIPTTDCHGFVLRANHPIEECGSLPRSRYAVLQRSLFM